VVLKYALFTLVCGNIYPLLVG